MEKLIEQNMETRACTDMYAGVCIYIYRHCIERGFRVNIWVLRRAGKEHGHRKPGSSRTSGGTALPPATSEPNLYNVH